MPKCLYNVSRSQYRRLKDHKKDASALTYRALHLHLSRHVPCAVCDSSLTFSLALDQLNLQTFILDSFCAPLYSSTDLTIDNIFQLIQGYSIESLYALEEARVGRISRGRYDSVIKHSRVVFSSSEIPAVHWASHTVPGLLFFSAGFGALLVFLHVSQIVVQENRDLDGTDVI